jgi:hypothetical protein
MAVGNQLAHDTSALARQLTADLTSHGWRLERVMNDKGFEFCSACQQTISNSAPTARQKRC